MKEANLTEEKIDEIKEIKLKWMKKGKAIQRLSYLFSFKVFEIKQKRKKRI